MPEGFNSLDDLKVVITAHTEDLKSGIATAKSIIQQFSTDSTGVLGKFDQTLTGLGTRIELVQAKIKQWNDALTLAMGTVNKFLPYVQMLTSAFVIEKEADEFKKALAGLGASILPGLTAPMDRANKTIADMNAANTGLGLSFDGTGKAAVRMTASMAEAEAEAKAAGREFYNLEGVDLSTAFIVRPINEANVALGDWVVKVTEATEAERVSAPVIGEWTTTVRQATSEVMDGKSALDAYAASVARLPSKPLANPFNVAEATTAMQKMTREVQILAGWFQQFMEYETMDDTALRGRIEAMNEEFLNTRKRIEEVQKGLTAWVDFGEKDIGKLNARLRELADEIVKAQTALTQRPMEGFDKILENLDKEIAKLELKERLYGLTEAAAAELMAREKAMAEIGTGKPNVEQKKLLEDRLATIKEIAERTAATKAKDDVLGAIEKVEDENEQLEFRRSLIGKTADEIARLTAARKVETLAKEKSVEIDDEMRVRLDREVELSGERTAALKAAEQALAADKALDAISAQAAALRLQSQTADDAAGSVARLNAQLKLLQQDERDKRTPGAAELAKREKVLAELEEATNAKKAADDARNAEKIIDGIEKQTLAAGQYERALSMTAGEAEALALQERTLMQLRERGIVITDEMQDRVQDLADAYGVAKDRAKDLEAQMQRMRETGQVFGKAMESAFTSWINGTKLKWDDLFRQLLSDLAVLALRQSVIQPLFGGGAGNARGLLGDAFASLLPKYAAGGRPSGLSIVGEEGPELFLPDQTGTIISNDTLRAVAGNARPAAPAITLSIDARGATPDAVAMLEARMPGLILQTVADARERGIIQ